MLDKGPSARSIQIELNPFTLVGRHDAQRAADQPAEGPFRHPVPFGVLRQPRTERHRPPFGLDPGAFRSTIEAAREVALRSRGTPRIANALLRRVRDFAMVKGGGRIDLEITRYALNALNIDSRGLDRMDNKILRTIIDKFGGGPVGLGTIATAVSEDTGTIEEVYEPFLIKEGFLKRTPRGREATELAYTHLGLVPPASERTLF